MAAKPIKYPKSLGACADLLYIWRAERLAADKAANALKEREQALIDHIIETMPADDTGAVGKTHTIKIETKKKWTVKDWPAFYAYISKTKGFDLLQRRVGEQALQARLDDGKKVPGIEPFNAKSVSLTKR